MSWLLPSALGIAAAAAVVVVALHFIARSRPLAEPLPTARFVPERPVYARTRSLALSDVALLLLRIAAILAIGLAIAGPMLNRSGRVARIIMVDRSRAVADVREVRDSTRAVAAANDVVIPFDSAATRATTLAALDTMGATQARGSLSVALAAATRVAARLSSDADSIEVVVISPLAREELDDATPRIRAAFPGRIRVVSVAAAPALDAAPRVEVHALPNDAVAAALALAGVASTSAPVRLVRGVPTRDDSTWATADGHVLVHWPATVDHATWTKRPTIDGIGGVTSGGATVIARFPRPWILSGLVVARWSDGEPAAVETAIGAGCVRDVGILIDEATDLALRAPFRKLALDLVAPCGGTRVTSPVDATVRASIAGSGSLAAATALRDLSTQTSSFTPWLLALAALLLIGELAMRRTERRVA